MAFSSGSSSGFSADINVTPLIDVLLVLLIIFMVIVPVMSRGVESSVPQPPKASSATPAAQLVIQVQRSASGDLQYRINQQELAGNALRPELARLFAARQDRTLFVQGARDLSYGDIAATIGEAKAAGALPIALLGPQMK